MRHWYQGRRFRCDIDGYFLVLIEWMHWIFVCLPSLNHLVWNIQDGLGLFHKLLFSHPAGVMWQDSDESERRSRLKRSRGCSGRIEYRLRGSFSVYHLSRAAICERVFPYSLIGPSMIVSMLCRSTFFLADILQILLSSSRPYPNFPILSTGYNHLAIPIDRQQPLPKYLSILRDSPRFRSSTCFWSLVHGK